MMLFLLALLLLCVWHTSCATVRYDLTVSAKWLAPDGHWRKTYVINGITPGPLVECAHHDTLRVHVYNALSIPISMHWHGQTQRRGWMDGVPGVTQWPILPKDSFVYEFECADYGMYWVSVVYMDAIQRAAHTLVQYHTHFLGAYDDGIRGPLFVRPGPQISRPWPLLTNASDEQASLEQAYQRGIKTMLFAWDHDEAEGRFIRLKGAGVPPLCFKSVLINGVGRVKCLDEQTRTTLGAPLPRVFGAADVNGCRTFLPADPRLSNPVECKDTAPLYPVFRTSESASDDGEWVVFHLVNAGSEAPQSFSIDDHDLWIIAADGEFVQPVQVQVVYLIVGARYSVAVRLNQPEGEYTIRSSFTNYPYQLLAGYGVLVVGPHSTNVQARVERLQRRQTIGVLGPEAVAGEQEDQNPSLLDPNDTATSVPVEEATPFDQSTESLSTTRPEAAQELPFTTSQLPLTSMSTRQWQRYDGALLDGAMQQDSAKLTPYSPKPPPLGPADLTVGIIINATGPLTWILAPSGNEFQSLRFSQRPILFAGRNFDSSDYEGTVFDVRNGSVVDVIFQSNGAPPHPIHKHQTKAWVLAVSQPGAGPFPWKDVSEGQRANASAFNIKDPPLRDGWEVPTNGYAVVRYQVTFPSVDLFHCHIAHHLASGMAFVVREGMELFDSSRIPRQIRNAAHVPNVRVNSSSNVGLDEI